MKKQYRPSLKSLIAAASLLLVAGNALAGAVGGASCGTDWVYARDTESYTVVMEGWEPASVWIEGDGDTDLDVWVWDEYGNLVASGVSAADREAVRWVPRRTGVYEIQIGNLGSVYNEFTLCTN